MALTDSSKASFLFFYEWPFVNKMRNCLFVNAHLAKGRGCDLSMSFPLVIFRRHNIAAKKLENLIRLHGFGESLAGTEQSLWGQFGQP